MSLTRIKLPDILKFSLLKCDLKIWFYIYILFKGDFIKYASVFFFNLPPAGIEASLFDENGLVPFH